MGMVCVKSDHVSDYVAHARTWRMASRRGVSGVAATSDGKVIEECRGSHLLTVILIHEEQTSFAEFLYEGIEQSVEKRDRMSKRTREIPAELAPAQKEGAAGARFVGMDPEFSEEETQQMAKRLRRKDEEQIRTKQHI